MNKEVYKFLELKDKLNFLKNVFSKYEVKLIELANAKEALNKNSRKVYRVFNDLIVEISKDEAIEYIEKSEKLLTAQLDKLKKEILQLEKELNKVIKCS